MIRWDPSARDCLPEYMKGIYMVFYDCVNQMAREAEKSQGRDTLTYARNTVWKIHIWSEKTYLFSSDDNVHRFVKYWGILTQPHLIRFACTVLVCSGKPYLMRFWKKQSGCPAVIYPRLRSIWRTGRWVLGIEQPHCNPFSRWIFPSPFTSCRRLISHPVSMTRHLPSFDYEVTCAATR